MLEIRDLVKVYPGPVPALRGVDLDLPEGMFGLLGPNGAGKSTLMQIVAGLLEPTSGSVRLDGENVVEDPARVWGRLGYLPQEFGFYPHLTGRDMLVHLLELKGVTGPNGGAAVADRLLEQVNLRDAADRKVKEYSGGMEQRLGVAQAIAGDPRLLIVDEPTAGLDPEERFRFYRILAELAEERIVLLSTHIVEDVSVLCPRFAVIREGEVVERTTPDDARRALEGQVYEGEADSAAIREGTVLRSLLVEGRERLRLHLPDGDPPSGFTAVEPTLEDAYLVRIQNGAARRESREGAAA
ncbi:MAG: ATP-binding cassette domain-containing protein [Candidatus Palauibacterales bacterium]|nr:ATP-binding cassette domain-containing protein [Candidatus Palauibacterales bacterium]